MSPCPFPTTITTTPRAPLQRSIIVGVKGGRGWAWGWARAEAQTLLDHADHRLTCMSLAGHGPKHKSMHRGLIIA